MTMLQIPLVTCAATALFGYTEEELKMIVGPMANTGQEPVGSMGNDAALAVLSPVTWRTTIL